MINVDRGRSSYINYHKTNAKKVSNSGTFLLSFMTMTHTNGAWTLSWMCLILGINIFIDVLSVYFQYLNLILGICSNSKKALFYSMNFIAS